VALVNAPSCQNPRVLRPSLLVALLAAAVAITAPASAAAYAPLDEPGPALSVPMAQLKASLHCEAGVAHAKVEPVLLSPGTSTTPEENFGWNWEPALEKLGIPWCAYTAPYQTLGPIDVSGEYLVYAIRTMSKLAGRRIAVMGHSQGGMSMRWTLRFWPDTRRDVADVIGLEGSNHGTTLISSADCALLGCVPADYQQAYDSRFVAALNSGAETFAGIDYTELYSHEDEVATPNTGPAHCTSCLHTGAGTIADIELQSVCPGDVADHVTAGTTDPVAYALAVDALTHPGPADPARIPRSACSQLLMPGLLDPAAAAALTGALEAGPHSLGIVPGPLGTAFSGAPVLRAEPALPCYVDASCAPTTRLGITVRPARVPRGRRVSLRVRVSVVIDGIVQPVPGATIALGGHRARTDAAGAARVITRFRARGRAAVSARAPEYEPAFATVRVR
jgi:pimeloyl-ACP methyl ester carboxylesterase